MRIDGPDELNGGSEADRLYRYGGGDWLHGGGGGNDALISYRGNDVLSGGTGEDTAHLYARSDADTVLDLSAGAGSMTSVAGVVVLTGIERLYFDGGAGQGRVTGTAGRDALVGYRGDDRLVGGGGMTASSMTAPPARFTGIPMARAAPMQCSSRGCRRGWR